ncbi:MAG: hypothetical protein JXA75_06745 [Candidatus Thermoplasmatota archaeon]|nr:hypothetical protein [Candidatus Thermoplasmatota archaeon]
MNKVVMVLGCGLLCVSLLSGCTQPTTSRSYTDPRYAFSLDPPVGWQQRENEDPAVAVEFVPVNSSDVSLRIAAPFPLSEGRALSTFADEVEQELSESGGNYTILYRDGRPLPELQAYEIAYSFEQEGKAVYVKQIALLRTRTVFLVTFAAPTLSAARYLPEVDQSIETFL